MYCNFIHPRTIYLQLNFYIEYAQPEFKTLSFCCIYFFACRQPVAIPPNINYLTVREYDLTRPAKLVLGDALAEISGISFYPKDSSVFAISDETGYLYKIHLKKGFLTEEWAV